MADAVTVASPSVSRKSYRVAGETIQQIFDDLQKKILPHSTDAVGDCATSVVAPKVTQFDEKENPKPKKKDTVEVTVTAKRGPKVTLTATITLPNLATLQKLSTAAKAEWNRFSGVLSAHEDQHLAAAVKVAEEVAHELSAMEGKGVGKDRKEAVAAAVKDFARQHTSKFSDAEISKRLDKAHKALDARGNLFELDLDVE